MLKYYFSFIIFFCCTSLAVLAQSAKLTWSEKAFVSDGDKFKPLGFAGEYHYFVVYPSSTTSVLLKYDRQNNLVEERTYKEKRDGVSLQLIDLIKTNDSNYLFFRGWDKKKKAWHLYRASLNDAKQGELVGFFSYESKYKPIYSDVANNDVNRLNRRDVYHYGTGTILTGVTGSINGNDIPVAVHTGPSIHAPSDRYGITISEDKNYVALVEAVHEREKELIFAVFDGDLNTIWKKRVHLSIPARKMSIKQTIVSEDGTIYMLAKNIKDFDEEALPDPIYMVYRIGKDGVLHQYDVKLEDGAIAVGAMLHVLSSDDKDAFIVTGLYTDDYLKSFRKGSFFVAGNAASGISTVHKNAFEPELLDKLSHRKRNKKRGLHKNYFLKSGFTFSGNSVGFVAELHSSGLGQRDITGNLVIPIYGLDGTLIKHQSVLKKNKGTSVQNSFLIQQVEERLYVFFNTDECKEKLEVELDKNYEQDNQYELDEYDEEYEEDETPYTDMLIMDRNGNIESRNCILNRLQTPLGFSPIFLDYEQGRFMFMGMEDAEFVLGVMQLR